MKDRPDVRKRVKALIDYHELSVKLRDCMWAEEDTGPHTREWNRLEKLTKELWPASLKSVRKDRKTFEKLRKLMD